MPTTDPSPAARPAPAAIPATMRAVVRDRYGATSSLRVDDVPVPEIGPTEVLVEVRTSTINPLDRYSMLGKPWMIRTSMGLRRPSFRGLGTDLAGVVAAVGSEVTDLAVGDEVLGMGRGAFAAYAVADADTVVTKPADVNWADASAVGVGAITALQGLRDHGNLEPGQRVLVNGAAGGVGTAAVQIAKWMGAEVTAVCSTRNVELMRSLGADFVVDYTQQDFTDTAIRYHVFFDNQTNRPPSACKKLMAEDGTYLAVGGTPTSRLLGPFPAMLRALVSFKLSRKRARTFIAEDRADDLAILRDLLEQGHLRPVIDSVHPLAGVGAAIDLLGTGHARGKIVVDVTT